MQNINFDDFAKIDIRVGEVIDAEDVEGSDKLIKQTVDFGELGKRTILSGIKKWYKPNDLIGKKLLYVTNLEPKEMFGFQSQGMLLAGIKEDQEEKEAVLIHADNSLEIGAKVV